MNSKIPTTL